MASLDELANNLDVNDLARTAAIMRAQYLQFTAWHANMNVLFPSAVMDRRLPGHASRRDVIGDLIETLRPTGIKILLISSLLAVSAFAWGVQDQGQLSLAARQGQRTKVFRDGRSLVAYHQSGTMVGGSARGLWNKATLFAQGTVFKDTSGALVAEVALWETTDPEGDLVWGVLWRPKDAPYTLEIKAGTGKWKGIAGKGRLLDGESRWELDWSIANLESAAVRGRPGDYAYHDSGFSFHGPHVTEKSITLPNGVTPTYNNQSGMLLSDDREAGSPRNLATSYDRGTTYTLGDKNLGDIM